MNSVALVTTSFLLLPVRHLLLLAWHLLVLADLHRPLRGHSVRILRSAAWPSRSLAHVAPLGPQPTVTGRGGKTTSHEKAKPRRNPPKSAPRHSFGRVESEVRQP